MITSIFNNLSGIYLIEIDKHTYIGSSINLYKRIKQHKSNLKHNRHDNQYMQRAYNKYKKFDCNVLEICKSITQEELFEKEKYYIELFQTTLNLKRDPTTQHNCETTSVPVYQFDLRGTFVKKWKSQSDAGRKLKIHSSNITKVLSGNQYSAGGYLWTLGEKPRVKLFYVSNEYGMYIGSYTSTVEIYEDLYSDTLKKTALSMIKTTMDKTFYKGYYISSTLCIKSVNFKSYVEVYKFDLHGNIIEVMNEKDTLSNRGIRSNLKGITRSNRGYVYSYNKDYYNRDL